MRNATRLVALAGAMGVTVAVGQPGVALAATPDTSSLTASGPSAFGPAADSEFFAGYAVAVGKNKTINVDLPVAKTGKCTEDKGVVARALQFNTDGDAAGALAFSACADGESIIFIRLVASDGTSVDVDQPTKAGDTISVTISEKKKKNTVKVVNNKQGWDESIEGPALKADNYNVGEGTVLLGETPLPLPDFGKAKFTGNKVGGEDLSKAESTKFDCVDASGDPRMTTSKISKGTEFTVTYKNP